MVDQPILNINGPANESLFSTPFHHIVMAYSSDLQAELDRLWSHYKDISDERLLALVGALCVEVAVQQLLEAFGSGFKNEADFSFFIKIKIAKGLRIIPIKILNSGDLI